MRRLRIGFLIDPIETLIVGHDSTFAFMLECQRRGHEVWYFEQKDLHFLRARAGARMRRVRVQKVPGSHFVIEEQTEAGLADLDAVFLRKDPPVDVEFLRATQFASLAAGETVLVNDPSALRDANEKLYALHFPELIPTTIVSRELSELRSFLDEVGGEMVVKPIDGFAGRGIFHVRRGDRNLNSILEVATRRGAEAVMAQRYLPESRQGDKRVILVGGEPAGAMLRVPQEDDVRGNLAAGARFEKTTLTERDREICARLGPDLRRRGLHFVGLDVIGRYLTEVNVTSPTGVEEVNALDGVLVERGVIDLVERLAAET